MAPPVGEAGVALKEWAAVEALLAAGEVVLLPRKGGLVETRGDFQVEHRRFWLFPTQYHQDPPELRPEFRSAADRARDSRPKGGRLPIRLRLEVAAAWKLEDESLLPRIAPHQPYGEGTLTSRFHYRGRPYLNLLLVRAHQLPGPFLLRRRASYRGCLSWVPLEEEIPEAGLNPVLDGAEFASRSEPISELLDGVAEPV
jgi:hypothetical protein